MVALLVAMSIMSVMLTVAMPVWHQMAQREKEAELIFRGQQYARAIGMFQRRAGPGALPPTLDVLVEQRFLRSKYKDPITGRRLPSADFRPARSRLDPGARSDTAAGRRRPAGEVRRPPAPAAQPRRRQGRHRVRASAFGPPRAGGADARGARSDGCGRRYPGRREQEQSEIHPAL